MRDNHGGSCYPSDMRRRPGILKRIDTGSVDEWVRSLSPADVKNFNASADRFLYPDRRLVRRMVDEELAELASRPASRLTKLAESELRSREGWRTPARWSMLIALAALALGIFNLFRVG